MLTFSGLSIERSGNSSVVVGKSQVEANEVISETAFQQQVKQLLRRLIILTQNLGSLPEKPFLGVKTSYHLVIITFMIKLLLMVNINKYLNLCNFVMQTAWFEIQYRLPPARLQEVFG